jgi:hypothetical protein
MADKTAWHRASEWPGGPRDLMAAEIIHHHDIAWSQGRDQELLEPGEEAFAIDRPIEYIWGDETVTAQTGDEGERFAWPMRDLCDQSLPRGQRPCNRVIFVFAQVSSRKISRAAETAPCERHRRDPVRWRVGFFEAKTNMVEEVPDAVVADFDPAFGQLGQEFATRDVGLLRYPSSYPRLLVGQREWLLASHRQRRGSAGFHGPLGPANRRGVAHVKTPRCLRPAHAASHRGNDALT